MSTLERLYKSCLTEASTETFSSVLVADETIFLNKNNNYNIIIIIIKSYLLSQEKKSRIEFHYHQTRVKYSTFVSQLCTLTLFCIVTYILSMGSLSCTSLENQVVGQKERFSNYIKNYNYIYSQLLPRDSNRGLQFCIDCPK